MRKVFLFAFLFLVFAINSLFADPVDKEKALTAATNFYSVRFNTRANLKLVYECKSDNFRADGSVQTYYYVFNSDNGFVILSGDDSAYPVLGYSDQGTFDPNIKIANFQYWLDNYKNQINYIVEHKLEATPEIEQEWNKIINNELEREGDRAVVVAPLCQALWGQDPYVNNLCPYDSQYGERTVTGCPATAMSIIMKRWNYPQRGTGQHAYNHARYGRQAANFGATTYEWNRMPNHYNNQHDADAIAVLMYHCGVGVEMNYGVAQTGGSGSYVIENGYPVNQTCEHAYKTYFGYDANTIRGLRRADYSEAQWIKLLKDDLDAGRPIQYAGFGQGGHTFVFDGYDSNNKFHVNWGWAGYADGYYYANGLNPGSGGTGSGAGTYNRGQQAVVGIQPAGEVGPAGNYELVMDTRITLDPDVIGKGEGFKLTTRIKNTGSSTFSGAISGAILDQDKQAVAWCKDVNGKLEDGYSADLELVFEGSEDLLPGNYKVVVAYNEQGGDQWTLVGDGSVYQNIADLEVTAGGNAGGLVVDSDITIDSGGNTIQQGDPFTVNVQLKNSSSDYFDGSVSVAFFNVGGEFIKIYKEEQISYIGGNGGTKVLSLDVQGVELDPGTYLLAIGSKKTGDKEYFVAAAEKGYENPIRVIVQEPALKGDKYEENNTESTAYKFPVSYGASGMATILTEGATLHEGTDKDFYKIDFPSGYKYTLEVRAHDKYKKDPGEDFTADVSWSYLYNNSWSPSHDAEMDGGALQVEGGTSVVFRVMSYTAGGTGTYLFDIKIQRSDDTAEAYTIDASMNPSDAGSVTGKGSYTEGETATLKAYAYSGYEFVNWTENGAAVSTNQEYSFTVDKDRVLVANYKKSLGKYHISAYSSPYLAGTITGEGDYTENESVTINASAKDGYKFVNWTEGGNKVSSNPSYTFTITSNRTLVANFEDAQGEGYSISASANPAAAGSVIGTGKYSSGETVSLKAVANSGYKFEKWEEDGQMVSSDPNYSFTVSRDRSLVAHFTTSSSGGDSYYIDASADPFYVANIEGRGYYEEGETVTLKVMLQSYYSDFKFIGWMENGTKVSGDEEYTFTASSDRKLIAKFERNESQEYEIEVSLNPSDAGFVTGARRHKEGETASLKSYAQEGYDFVNWTEGGNEVSTEMSYSFEVKSNRNLVANYVKVTTAVELEKDMQFRVYPNPTANVVNVEFDASKVNSDTVKVLLYDELGKLQTMGDFTISGNKVSVDVSDKDTGVYYLQLIVDGVKLSKEKVVITE